MITTLIEDGKLVVATGRSAVTPLQQAIVLKRAKLAIAGVRDCKHEWRGRELCFVLSLAEGAAKDIQYTRDRAQAWIAEQIGG